MTKEGGLARAFIAIAVVAVVFNCVYFLVPFIHFGVFWGCYFWSWVALLAFAGANAYFAHSSRDAMSGLYRVSLVVVSFAYLVVAMVCNLVFVAAIPFAPMWMVSLLNVVLLALFALGFVGGEAGASLVEEDDARTTQRTAAISMLRQRAQMAQAAARPGAAYTDELNALVDDLRYSDPVSNQASLALEDQLSGGMTQLAQLIDANDQQGVLACCTNLRALLRQRNMACKMGK